MHRLEACATFFTASGTPAVRIATVPVALQGSGVSDPGYRKLWVRAVTAPSNSICHQKFVHIFAFFIVTKQGVRRSLPPL